MRSLKDFFSVPGTQVRRLRSASYSGSPSAKPCEDLVARLNGGGLSSPHGANNVFSEIIATTVGSPQTPSTPRDKVSILNLLIIVIGRKRFRNYN